MSPCRPSIVTFPLALRVSDIAAFVHQHATCSTPPLVSAKFPHVPLGVGGWRLATKSEGVSLIVRAISF